jgi:HAMP domain-containing protein
VGRRADSLATQAEVFAFLDARARGQQAPPPLFGGELSQPDLRAVAVVDPAGTIALATTNPSAAVGSRYFLTGSKVTDDWFTQAVGGRSSFGALEVDERTGSTSLIVGAPARRPGSAAIGVVAIEVRGEDLAEAIATAANASGDQRLLVNSDGIVVVARDSRLVGRSLREIGLGSVQSALAEEPSGTVSDAELRDRGRQIAAYDTTSTGAAVVVLQPRDRFFGPIDDLAATTNAFLVVVGLIAVAVAVILARRLSRRVRVLTTAALAVEAEQPVPETALAEVAKSHDDIGRLARVFAKMAEQVAIREQRLREQVKALRVEIDQERRRRSVEEVTDSDFFRDLQTKAATMRERVKGQDE